MGGLTNFSLRLFIRTKQELRQYDLTLNLHFIFARDLSLFGVYRRAAAILKHRECFERPSIQFHIHDDVFWLVALEHAQPALAPVDADARAAFVSGVIFNLTDQRQPALHVDATAWGRFQRWPH
jgi:hypothetical protein